MNLTNPDFTQSFTWDPVPPRRLDMYFQPALSWLPDGTRGIALLFLENYAEGGDITRQDFKVLTQWLITWTAAASGVRPQDSLSAADLGTLLDGFARTPLAWTQVQQFLQAHFDFHFQECTTEMQATVFPMFPELELVPGNGAARSFSDPAHRLSEADANDLRAYFGEMQAQFESGDRPNPIVADSVAAYLFTGYVRLIIRSGLQAVQEYAATQAAPQRLGTLLSGVSDAAWGNTAQIASRFLLHGLNLPEGTFEVDDPRFDEGIYANTRQQFRLEDALQGNAYHIRLQASAGAHAYLKFTGNGLDYTLPADEDAADPKYALLGLARALDAVHTDDLAQFPSTQPEAIPFYHPQHLHFALRTRLEWPQSTVTRYVLPLPGSLRDHLKQRDPNPQVRLVVWPEGDPARAADVPGVDFLWATRIGLSFTRVADTETNGLLSGVYQLNGSSEEDKDLLEAAWNYLNGAGNTQAVALDLLTARAQEGGTQVLNRLPGTQAEYMLLRNNLSNDNPEAQGVIYSALQGDARNFLKLVWEGLNSNGGYFLHIPNAAADADTAAFGAQSQAELHLLISFNNPADPILDFHNCAVFDTTADVEDDLILARSAETMPVLTLPPGYLGFRIGHREAAQPEIRYPDTNTEVATALYRKPDFSSTQFASLPTGTQVFMIRLSADGRWVYGVADGMPGWVPIQQPKNQNHTEQVLTVPPGLNDGPAELEVLYQMLGFQVMEHTLFRESGMGLPMGPTQPDPAGNFWLYERMIPVFSLVKGTVTDVPGLPPASRSPYRGVGAASGNDRSEIQLETWWQDVYGNQLLAGKSTTRFPVQYTDPLLGINQWPSVTEQYFFSGTGAANRMLNLELRFDPGAYLESAYAGVDNPAAALNNRLRSDLGTWERIFYQLSQADLRLTLRLSVDPSWSHTSVDKAGLLTLAGNVYRYLSSRLRGEAGTVPAAFTQAVSISSLTVQSQFIFEIRATLEMQRELRYIHTSLLQGNAIRPEHEGVLRSLAVLSPRFVADATEAGEGESLAEVAASVDTQGGPAFTVVDLVRANATVPNVLDTGTLLRPEDLDVNASFFTLPAGTWEEYVALRPAGLTTLAGETLDGLRARFEADIETALDRPVSFGLEDLAAVIGRKAGLMRGGVRLRIAGLSMRPFAQDFQTIFPGLYLAVSEDRRNTSQTGAAAQPLFAAQMGAAGLRFDIAEQLPVYYAIPPLNNTQLSGTVPVDQYAAWKGSVPASQTPAQIHYTPTQETKQLDSIDLNVQARNFLVNLEKFLDAPTLIPANRLNPARVSRILQQKTRLAAAISGKVQPVLLRDLPSDGRPRPGQEEAARAIRQELLNDLVQGFDIETIVQFDVTVQVGAGLRGKLNYPAGLEPRVLGKARVLQIRAGEFPGSSEEISPGDLDYTLSTGKIRLRNDSGTSSFTYLFDTRSPERFANLELQMEFVPTQIEYDLARVNGISEFESSNWLNFILADDLRQSMGASPVPIPLRSYPAPPSLIFQQAEPDPTSLTALTDVRQWKYTIVYEHPDVSQDSVDCILQLNLADPKLLPTASGSVPAAGGLFASLLNFAELYPQLSADLHLLRDPAALLDPAKVRTVELALAALETVVTRVAADWGLWRTGVSIFTPAAGDVHAEISEETLDEGDKQGIVTLLQTVPSRIGGPALLPLLELPGYKQKRAPEHVGNQTIFTFEPDPEDQTFFGDSSVPDRKFMVENLDVIEHQNAWASVWLSRNKHLLEDRNGLIATNPAFIFQTPAVRFQSLVTPFITNDEPWNLGLLGGNGKDPVQRTLEGHLNQLFGTLFPYLEDARYEVRLSCQYAFAMAKAQGLNEDLVTRLPILISLRVDPDALNGTYAADLAREIHGWFAAQKPSLDFASLLFSVDMFSRLDPESNTSLPMLRITRMQLNLADVTDLG